jgi:hypothetical protein
VKIERVALVSRLTGAALPLELSLKDLFAGGSGMTRSRAVWPLVLAALASCKNTTSGPRTDNTLPPRTFRMADVAWGPPPGAYQGAETDFHDFPFNEVLALSSYPYFVYSDAAQIPLDYYTRIANGRTIPIMVVEGGWTSAAVGSVQSSPAKQAAYLRRQEKLLDSAKAIAVFELNFSDIDLSAYQPLPNGSTLPLFASLGFVNAGLVPKPALATHDSILSRPLRP